MRVDLFFGVRLDHDGQVPILVRSYDHSPYLHFYGGTDNRGGVFVGVRLHTLAEASAVLDVPLDTLHATTHALEGELRAFEGWLALLDQTALRTLLGQRQPRLLIIADSD